MTFYETVKNTKAFFFIANISILFAFLLIAKKFAFAIIVLAIIAVLIFFWYRMLGEELFIHDLKKNSCNLLFKKIIGDMLEEKGKAVINRLIRKRIVKFENDIVYLIDQDRVTAFEARLQK